MKTASLIVLLTAVLVPSTALAQTASQPTSPPPTSQATSQSAEEEAAAAHAAVARAAKATAVGLARIHEEAKALQPLVRSDLVKRFLAAVDELPTIKPRSLYFDPEKGAYVSRDKYEAMSDTDRKQYRVTRKEEDFYYYTRYGTPLAYSRALDILAAAGLDDLTGKRIVDYGYGGIGHLRLMALCGADAVGVDVDPMLPMLYNQPDDQGEIKPRTGKPGRVTIVDGRWPADDAARKSVGQGFDVFLSKNTLKKGYIHPEQMVDDRMLVKLGVDDSKFVQAMFDVLKPGGIALIYNICPAKTPVGVNYKPWSDGRSPFMREMYEKAGFTIAEFDTDDTPQMRELAVALGWDKGSGKMDLEKDFVVSYVLLRKPK